MWIPRNVYFPEQKPITIMQEFTLAIRSLKRPQVHHFGTAIKTKRPKEKEKELDATQRDRLAHILDKTCQYTDKKMFHAGERAKVEVEFS